MTLHTSNTPAYPTKSTLALALFYLVLCMACTTRKPTAKANAAQYIRLNQVGYYPHAQKKAYIVQANGASAFMLVNTTTRQTVFTGQLGQPVYWPLAGDTVRVADFTAFQASGAYTIQVPGLGQSHPFSIQPGLYHTLLTSAAKSYYYQRAGQALPAKHAGQWQRAAGHPDTNVQYHPSTGRSGQAASPAGWYDAGDYGKYVVNGAVSLGQMLMLHQQYPQAIQDGRLNIPESGNGIPDLLDELKYEMDWLLTMQDGDGGVFTKLTTKNFAGMVMPNIAIQKRFIIGKSTAATATFAAVAAKFARAYQPYSSTYAQQCLQAAQKAWQWALANPETAYTNPGDINTGEYGDKTFWQELYWAASELYATTKNQQYLTYLQQHPPDMACPTGESWANFGHVAGFIAVADLLNDSTMKATLVHEADRLMAKAANNAYGQPVTDFQWGSNSDVLNTAIYLAQAYRYTKKEAYLQTALQSLHYVLGANATGYSFITGFGAKSPMHIHHRPSAADGIPDPIPGFIAGGPNAAMQDRKEVQYPPNAPPMKCWADQLPSYASNEVCLNWNAPLVYLTGFIEQNQTNIPLPPR